MTLPEGQGSLQHRCEKTLFCGHIRSYPLPGKPAWKPNQAFVAVAEYFSELPGTKGRSHSLPDNAARESSAALMHRVTRSPSDSPGLNGREVPKLSKNVSSDALIE